jgi:hypothetical protein
MTGLDSLMKDFEIFYSAARCVLSLQSPYTCGFFYPLPSIILFLPFAVLPLNLAKISWFAISLIALVYTLKRRTIWFVLFISVLQAFFYGQVDLILLPALASQSGLGMAMLVLKPQLAVLWLPFWFWYATKEQRRIFLITSAIIWLGSLAIYPRWLIDFMSATRPVRQAAYASPSLWGGSTSWVFVVLVGAGLLALSRYKYAATMVVNPAINTYDLTMLVLKAPWWIVPISWFIFIFSQRSGNAWSYVVLSLLAVVYHIPFRDYLRAVHAKLFPLAEINS